MNRIVWNGHLPNVLYSVKEHGGPRSPNRDAKPFNFDEGRPDALHLFLPFTIKALDIYTKSSL